MAAQTQEALAQLRDIHLPAPVSWWPPAQGWWGLALLLLAVVALLSWWLRRRAKALPSLRESALAELERIEQQFRESGDSARLAAQLSVLLRRVAISAEAPAEVAGLSGEAWLAYLDEKGGGEAFRHGPGRVVLSAPYRAEGVADGEALLVLVRGWIERHG